VVIDLPDTLEVVVISSEEYRHQEEEDDPEEDQEIDEVMVEQQWKQEIDQLMVELQDEQGQQVQQEVGDAESKASTSSFDLGEEPDNESNPDCDLSTDR